jgi:mono/diheme cytochrome c family protein
MAAADRPPGAGAAPPNVTGPGAAAPDAGPPDAGPPDAGPPDALASGGAASDRAAEPVPEAGGVLDLQPDVERLHRAVRREPRDPVEGREPVPWWFLGVVALALFWGGWYLGRYGGEFDTQPHIAFAARQPGIAGEAAAQSAAAVSNPVEAGERVYAQNCQGCHQASGRGVAGAFPPVVGSEWVTGAPETLGRILLHGLQGPVEVSGATYNGAMPAWKDVLKDEEIAAVLTYIRQLAPNAAAPVAPTAVAALRTAHADRAQAWTAAELRAAEGTAPPAAASTTAPAAQAGPTPMGPPAAGPAAQGPKPAERAPQQPPLRRGTP